MSASARHRASNAVARALSCPGLRAESTTRCAGCAGERIGRGASTEEAIAATHSVIEGIPTARSVLQLAARHNVEMPIVSAVASVLFDNRSPAEAIHKLMTRRLGEESTF